LTFGLFSLVLTAFMVEIMDYFVAGINVASFWWALVFGLIVSAANSMIDRLFRKPKVARTHKSTSGEYVEYQEVE